MAKDIDRVKLALIAGASRALEYKKKNPMADEDEVLQYISDKSEEIVRHMG